MSDFVDLMLDGVICEGCGEFLGDPVGYPQSCPGCEIKRSGDRVQPVRVEDPQGRDYSDDDDLPF
jgi:hypothetical protein